MEAGGGRGGEGAAHLARVGDGLDEGGQVRPDLVGAHAHHHRQAPGGVLRIEGPNHGHQVAGVDLVRDLQPGDARVT